MFVIGIDSYNLTTSGGVTITLQAARSDNEHIPCVIIVEEKDDLSKSNWSIDGTFREL